MQVLPEKELARLLEDFERPCVKKSKRRHLLIAAALVAGLAIGMFL